MKSMFKFHHLLYAALLFLTNLASASNTIDSIGVESKNGKKVIIYKVESKETYYSIAKKYNITHFDLMEFNNSKLLQIGETIKIPTKISAPNIPLTNTPSTIISNSNTESPIVDEITYTVKAKDNLNAIAKLYNTTVEQIKSLNNLNSINLQIGQVLRISKSSTPIQNAETAAPTNNNAAPTYNSNVVNASPTIRRYKAVITHKVKSGETLTHIAQRYDMSVDDIKKLNKLQSNSLRIGQAVKVQVTKTETIYPNTQTTTNQPVTNAPSNSVAGTNATTFEHTVTAGETIYSIARKYNLTTYQLTTTNNLNSNNLTVGQKLTIKSNTPQNTSVSAVQNASENTLDEETLNDPKLRQPASKFGLTRIDEKGTAVWITDPDLDETKMLVLHKTAPIGTIIRITNPTTNRSAFAKVVGKFTENETTKDVIIVVTKMVADAVGALDKRFYCTINYGAVDND